MRQLIITSVIITAIIGHIFTRFILADNFQISSHIDMTIFGSSSVTTTMDRSFITEVRNQEMKEKEHDRQTPDARPWKNMLTMIEE